MDLPNGFDDGLTNYFELAARRSRDETMSMSIPQWVVTADMAFGAWPA
jgi:hypothetical protein